MAIRTIEQAAIRSDQRQIERERDCHPGPTNDRCWGGTLTPPKRDCRG
jgi:hypothetical protein